MEFQIKERRREGGKASRVFGGGLAGAGRGGKRGFERGEGRGGLRGGLREGIWREREPVHF